MALFDPVRYFLNTAAAKPVVAGGYTFEFELVGLRGGSWLGILAVDEPAASVLAAAHPSNTDEISLEIYNLQKKKVVGYSASITKIAAADGTRASSGRCGACGKP